MIQTRLEADTGKLKLEIAVLQEQKSNLESSFECLKNKAAEDALRHSQAVSRSAREYEKKLAQQESSSNRIFGAEERRASRVERELDEAKKELLDVKKGLGESENTVAVLKGTLTVINSELEAVKDRA